MRAATVSLLVLVMASVAMAAYSTSRVRMDADGGYAGIAIRIKDSVPEEKCAELLQNMKTLFTEASGALYTALKGKAFLKQATVIVPSSWRDVKCMTKIQTPRGNTAFVDPDIYITESDPVHGQSPFTQQSRGCGQPGDFTALPVAFVEAANSSSSVAGKMLVHEWCKLRYGVFDERGFSGDPIYPASFKGKTRTLVTGTSNVPVDGVWSNDSEQECDPFASDAEAKCTFKPSSAAEANRGVTCSLGFAPALSSVSAYCPASEAFLGTDGVMPPTKHNGLCRGKSALDVILESEDLQGRQSGDAQMVNALPPFTLDVVKQPKPKYVLVMETSAAMGKDDLWKWVSRAARKFVGYDVPDGTSMALVTFSNDSAVAHPLVQLDDDRARRRLADTIPDKYRVQSNPDKRCVICGVQKAMSAVLGIGNGSEATDGDNSEAGGHIIIISRGDNQTVSLVDENLIMENARAYNVRFSSILVPEPSQPAVPFYDLAAMISGGRSFVLPAVAPVAVNGETLDPTLSSTADDEIGPVLYSKLMEAFQELRRVDETFPSEVPVRVHTLAARREAPALRSTGQFAIDTTLGRDTRFGVIVADADDYYIKSVRFSDSQGQSYGPYTSLSSDLNVINIKTINFPQDTAAPPFDDPAHLGMTWNYEIEWYPGGDAMLQNVVLVESKPRNLGTFGLMEVRVWTSADSDSATDIATDVSPLAIYASVTRGNSPVIDAKVTVEVYVDAGNGTEVKSGETIVLFDKGNGDPDLVGGDGIYSRYLTTYVSPGRYRFVVSADDNGGAAYSVLAAGQGRTGRASRLWPQSRSGRSLSSGPEQSSCCGSRVVVAEGLRQQTGAFARTQLGGGHVVHLLAVPNSKTTDRMPPARIGDLRVTVNANRLVLENFWTAPGDDFDAGGPVAGYRFVFSENVADLIEPSRQPAILHTLDRSGDAPGSDQTYAFAFNHYDRDVYVAVYAVDEAGNRGNVSNAVLVRMPAPPVTDDPDTSDDADSSKEKAPTDWVMVGIVTGIGVTLVLCLLVGLYLYFFCARRKHQQQRASSSAKSAKSNNKSSGVNVDLHHTSSGSDSSGYAGSDLKNLSSHNLVPPAAAAISTISGNKPASNGTSFGNGLTPTYWSASQLLKGHEERQRKASTNPVHMNAIAEEAANMEGFVYGNGYSNGGVLSDGGDVYYGEHVDYPYTGQDLYQQRFSTASAGAGSNSYYPGMMGYHPISDGVLNATLDGSSDTDSNIIRNNNNGRLRGSKAGLSAPQPRHSGSDNSSAALAAAGGSLQGSLLSLNSGRQSSTQSKQTRNITQV